MADNEYLKVVFSADTRAFEKSLSKAEKRVYDFGNKINKVGKNLTLKVTLPLAGLGAKAVHTAMEFEKLQGSLETLTGSARAGAREFERLQKFSASTPFQLKDLLSATQIMMGFGVSAEESYDALKMIADISAVSQGDLKGIALAFAQVSANGRLMGDDLRQLINNGVPVIDMLAKSMNVATSEVKGLVSEGAVGIDQLTEAFRMATSEGGKFAGGAVKASQTMSGAYSTLKDNIDIALGDIGKNLIETFKLDEKITELTDKIKDLTPEALEAYTTFGLWASAIPIAITVVGSLAVNVVRLKKAVEALTLAMAKNPFMAIAVGGLAVGGALYQAHREQKTLNEELQRLIDLDPAKIDNVADSIKEIEKAQRRASRATTDLLTDMIPSSGMIGDPLAGIKAFFNLPGLLGFEETQEQMKELESQKNRLIAGDALAEAFEDFNQAGTDVSLLRDAMQKALETSAKYRDTFPEISKSAQGLGTAIGQLINDTTAQAKAFEESYKKIDQVLSEAGVKKPKVPVGVAPELEPGLLEQQLDEALSQVDISITLPVTARPIIMEGSMADLNNQIGRLQELQRTISDPEQIAKLKEQIDQLKQQYRQLLIDAGLLTEQNTQLTSSFDLMGMIASSVGDILSNAFANALIQAKGFEETLRNIGRLLLNSALQFGIKAFLQGGLSQAGGFFGQGGGLLGSIFGTISPLEEIPVNDALITSAGQIVKFHPNDNILAMKDLSYLAGQQNMNVTVTGEIRGEDIFVSGYRGGNRYSR